MATRSHLFGPHSQNANTTETYSYDSINRLTNRAVTITAQGNLPSGYTMTQSYAYDGFGNFTSKSGVGNYSYNANKQLTGISGTKSYSFSNQYDSNGNILYDGSRSISYTSFDKPNQLSNSTASTAFEYGMGHSRYYRYDNRSDGQTHTAYLGGVEKKVKNSTIEYQTTVGNIIIIDRSNATNNSAAEHYLHQDHQGSALSITNESGAVVQHNVYDPWGRIV